MKEDFLHFVWRYQKLVTPNLETTEGERLAIFYPGHYNLDSGPDFEEARIKIGTIEWMGNLEIHIRSSDWARHKHIQNRAYDSVILHVVWEHDYEVLIDGKPIPTLELKRLVDPYLVESYSVYANTKKPIACSVQDLSKSSLAFISMIEKSLVERLERKANEILTVLRSTQNDWNAACFQTLARAFGFSTNKNAFSKLSTKAPFSIIKKLTDLTKVEALLFGQAGFLTNPIDSYQKALMEEYAFLSRKYNLPPAMDKHEWKFGRLRPANTPALRIAQLSGYITAYPSLLSHLIDSSGPRRMNELVHFELSEYWSAHYDFGKPRNTSKAALGQSSRNHLLINAIVPLMSAYSKFTDNPVFMEKALLLLESISPEHNRIISHWSAIDKSPQNAFESQGQIHLFEVYCKNRKCLSCSVGVSLLNK